MKIMPTVPASEIVGVKSISLTTEWSLVSTNAPITLPIFSSHFSRNRHHRPAPKSVR